MGPPLRCSLLVWDALRRQLRSHLVVGIFFVGPLQLAFPRELLYFLYWLLLMWRGVFYRAMNAARVRFFSRRPAKVEAKIFELQEAMADRGYSDVEIEEKVNTEKWCFRVIFSCSVSGGWTSVATAARRSPPFWSVSLGSLPRATTWCGMRIVHTYPRWIGFLKSVFSAPKSHVCF